METMEKAHVALMEEILEHNEKDCPFCKENKPPEKLESNIEQSWDDDQLTNDKYWTEKIGNDSGDLEKDMEAAGYPRPKDWRLKMPVYKCGKQRHSSEVDLGEDHIVKANPHHLIPGNASLKKCRALRKWIFASEKKITGDIGYDINNDRNGIWLPSNNAMRGDSRWDCETVKMTYANASQPGRGSFHDAHVDYNKFVKRLLKRVADRMEGIDVKNNCPYKTEKDENSDKFKPPYALVSRLNGISQRLKGYLKLFNPDDVKDPLYTSKIVIMRNQMIKQYGKNTEAFECAYCKKMKKEGKN